MMRLVLTFGLGLAMVTSRAAAGEMPLPPGAGLVRAAGAAEAEGRRQWVDLALRSAPTSVATPTLGYSSDEVSQMLRRTDAAALRLAAAQAAGIQVNPEPSSLMVWLAAALGIAAAGYGYRRRQDHA